VPTRLEFNEVGILNRARGDLALTAWSAVKPCQTVMTGGPGTAEELMAHARRR
jgi:hypothetical protein